MCKRFDDWSEQIREYCEENGFDFEKAKKLSKSWGKDNLALAYYDKTKGNTGLGLLDDTPMPLVLWISETKDGLIFKQTEYTRQYLT